ncbi:MAG: hemin uptake protein HemP [Hydrogenophaga sp.]|nr:hemin uptake protein HemP [Hydrogenophaga sp.]
MTPDPRNQQPGSRPCDSGNAVRRTEPAVNSQTLLRGQKVVAIEHNGELYRLQNTRAGKLILTK